jgi:hypothetical protein
MDININTINYHKSKLKLLLTNADGSINKKLLEWCIDYIEYLEYKN